MKPGDKRFWKLSSSLRGKRKTQIPHLKQGNEILIADSEKAEKLAHTFAQSHYLTIHYTHPSETQINNSVENLKQEPPNLDGAEFITMNELTYVLAKLKNNKAPGFDNIPNILLKHLPVKAVKILKVILNSCIRLNYFPSVFKKAKVIAVHKPNKPKNNPNSYRPISLLSNIGKVFEKLIHNRINGTIHQISRNKNKILSSRRNKKSLTSERLLIQFGTMV